MTKQEILKKFQVGTKLVYYFKEGKKIWVIKKINKKSIENFLLQKKEYDLVVDIECILDSTEDSMYVLPFVKNWICAPGLILLRNDVKVIPPINIKINKLLNYV